jgi:hypothetical protein
MANDTILVIGIHREELGFGDRVSAPVDPARVDVMRIPWGIPRAKKGQRERFYSRAQHREIYLQVHQQVKDRYRLMIDLHRGLDEKGRCADVFCHDETFLRCLGAQVQEFSGEYDVHLIRIVSPDDHGARSNGKSVADAEARTWIPSRIWLGGSPLYVGLEVYLTEDGDGKEEDWKFAHLLIDEIQACMPCCCGGG